MTILPLSTYVSSAWEVTSLFLYRSINEKSNKYCIYCCYVIGSQPKTARNINDKYRYKIGLMILFEQYYIPREKN